MSGDVLAGGNFVAIGRGAILHHDYPQKVTADALFEPVALPVSRAHLENKEGLSETFVCICITGKASSRIDGVHAVFTDEAHRKESLFQRDMT